MTIEQKIEGSQEVPLTFEKTIETILKDYEANSKLSDLAFSSVTLIAYKAGTTNYKIKVNCDEIKNKNIGFGSGYLSVNYDSLKAENGWVELDSADPTILYNGNLSREEVKAHKGWLAIMNGNQDLLNKYVDAWFNETGRTYGMGFYVRRKTYEDELCSVAIIGGDFTSFVSGECNIDYCAAFDL